MDGPFVAVVKTDVTNGLHIVPVQIGGKEYRFLFDTGAMFSISSEIQNEMKYKKVSKGTLTDSDNNRSSVDYVKIDTIFIGGISFMDQTAFVADFTRNPIIKCLGIDGIIGSNLMRHCKWTIDYQNAEIVLFKDTLEEYPENAIKVPFTQSRQFDQIVSLKLGNATLNNLKIDYGSNGSLTLSKGSMKVLKEHGIITQTYSESGYKSSGLYGKLSPGNREFAWADTLRKGDLLIEGVKIKTGKSGLIGGEILSRFVVTLDFENNQLHLVPVPDSEPDYRIFGFSLGYNDDKGFYVQLVTENSPAHKAGLTPGMKVIRYNELDFSNGSTFCDYVGATSDETEEIVLEYIDAEGETKELRLQRAFMF